VPRRALLLSPLGHRFLIRGPLQGLSLTGSLLKYRLRCRQVSQSVLPPRDLVAHDHPVGPFARVRPLRQREQLLDLGTQLRLDLLQPFVADRLALGGVGVDLGPIQAERAQREHARFLRQQQHLHEQVLEVRQKGGAEGRDGVVVGVPVAGDVAKRHRLIRRALDRARPEHARRVPIEEQGEEPFGRIGLTATRSVAGVERREVKQGHAIHHEAGQMVRRQAVAQAHRQVKRRVVVHGLECSTHASYCTTTHGAESPLLSDKLLATRYHEAKAF